MKIAVFQFSGSGSILNNKKNIIHAIEESAEHGVRLLVFQECALCGYVPVETGSLTEIDFQLLESAEKEIAVLSKKHNMYISFGTIRRWGNDYYNCLKITSPSGESLDPYDKRALWGWDSENFRRGENPGIYEIDGIKIGFRICFEIRFPEYFRELYKAEVKLCFVSFCDVSDKPSEERYTIIKSHLITRAVENVMTVVSVNSISHFQTAPTAVISPNGKVILEAPKDEPVLLIHDYTIPEISFGMEGRIKNSDMLLESALKSLS